MDIVKPVYRGATPPPAEGLRQLRRANETQLRHVLIACACLLAAGCAPGSAGEPAITAMPGAPAALGEPTALTGPTAPTAPTAWPSNAPAPTPEASPSASTPTAAPTLEPRIVAALQRSIDLSRTRIPSPGLSVAVRLDDGRAWAGVSGNRQLDPARPVTPSTQFAVASITKTFVAAAVMQLVDEGRLSLDDRLARWLPRYPRARQITVRELLSHTSGIQNYFESPRYNRLVFADRSHRWTFPEILDLVGAPYCAPGDCFHYSNTNFVLLGRVVEQVTGERLSRVIRDRFGEPLELDHTVFQPDEPTARNSAHGFLWSGGDRFADQSLGQRVVPHLSAITVTWAAGAMASTASDLARWAEALYGGRVVSPAALDAMTTFRRRDEYGLGTRTRIFEGRRAVGHLGGVRGFENAMWYFPREGATIVVLSNRGIYNTDKTVRLLARALFNRIDVPPPKYDPKRNTH
jgi:D-alanyl-D-alanine carboxypeptidase